MNSGLQMLRSGWVVAVLTALVWATVPARPAWAATTGSGQARTETREVSDFDGIALAGSIGLVVRQSGREAVEVRADDNLLPLIETVVESGVAGRTLHVRIKRGESVRTKTPIVVTVDLMRLTRLASAGSGDVRIENLKSPKLKLSLSGSSDAKLQQLAIDELTLSVAGSGSVSAAGTAGQAKASIAGSGNLELKTLVADDVSISIAGSGDAKVTANKALRVSIAGSGDVEYSGDATEVKSSVAGSGRVTRR